jgi:hypothetical protein
MAFQPHEKSMLSSRKFCGYIIYSLLPICRVGGGGNKQNRNTKIYEKNQKLNEQRIRRMNEEEKAKLAKKDLAIYHGDIHPSRRARVPDNS